jgi:formate-dependent nitrite reductase membrane component NrfD
VVVCPEQAIWAGDINDPNSAISKEIATHQVRARKPEQGTKPKLFYIDAEESVIVPGLAQQSNVTLWSSMPENGSGGYHDWRGPLQLGEGKMAGALINTAAAPREVYNTPHRIPWHWPVPAYLVTKSIGTGIFMIAAAGLGLGVLPNMPLFTSIAGALSLLFIAITTVLLIADLDKPSRFLSILTRPQWRSWLARGAYILIGFSIVGGLWWLGQILGGQIQNAASILIVPGIILAALTAIYTAFLFAQAEGRDLWQSPILAPHLFVQAVMAGAAGLLICSLFIGITPQALQVLTWVFVISTLANVLFIISEFSITHASAVASMAAHLIKKSKYRKFYLLAVIVGGVIPLALVLVGIGSLGIVALASVCSLIGLGAYEWAFVMAPQEIPNN